MSCYMITFVRPSGSRGRAVVLASSRAEARKLYRTKVFNPGRIRKMTLIRERMAPRGLMGKCQNRVDTWANFSETMANIRRELQRRGFIG